ncbi:MAG: hypothetical protein LiPW15_15 [Parcubacteria group bacterium LiPW_15]|nr:MAG: hypothetical protein LiPW15_15 [Parcubacteria group bacterium LiPW_15]
MSLSEKITEELKTAMRAGDTTSTGLLRFLISQIRGKEKEKFGAQEGVLTDEEVLDVFAKEAKKRKEAIALFEQGGRKDLADKEKAELAMIERYLPAQLGKDEIRVVVKEIISGGASTFPLAVKEAMARLKGQADGKLVSEIIKEELGS